MIISHQYKFIFLKTKKTAGTSVEIALSRLCNEQDIVTPILEEELRKKEGGRAGKRVMKPWYKNSVKEVMKNIARFPLPNKKINRKVLFYNHVPASTVKNNIPPKIWDNYLKITIERNPWDRAISAFYWYHRSSKENETKVVCLEELAEKWPSLLSNWNIYTINNEIAVDRVLFFETLNEDFFNLTKELGVENLNLPKNKIKAEYRKNHRHYREILSESDAELIRKVCKREIDTFGYQF
jgi:hypothetical protein